MMNLAEWYYTGISLPLYGAFYGNGKGVIWYSDVQCTGNESSLGDCKKEVSPSITDISCKHSRDANVICTGQFTSQLWPGTKPQPKSSTKILKNCVYFPSSSRSRIGEMHQW